MKVSKNTADRRMAVKNEPEKRIAERRTEKRTTEKKTSLLFYSYSLHGL